MQILTTCITVAEQKLVAPLRSGTQRCFHHPHTVSGNVECTAILKNNMAISYSKKGSIAKDYILDIYLRKIKMYAHAKSKQNP